MRGLVLDRTIGQDERRCPVKASTTSITTIDQYMEGFPEEVRALLGQMRETIRKAAPEATEKISYQIPTFDYHGNLVHFAAFTHHIGFYPGPTGIAAFEGELKKYNGAKGSVQFPMGEPLPLQLVARIVKFRVAENAQKKKGKKAKKAT